MPLPCVVALGKLLTVYQQQHLHKVPNGYYGITGTGVSCPIGVVKLDAQ